MKVNHNEDHSGLTHQSTLAALSTRTKVVTNWLLTLLREKSASTSSFGRPSRSVREHSDPRTLLAVSNISYRLPRVQQSDRLRDIKMLSRNKREPEMKDNFSGLGASSCRMQLHPGLWSAKPSSGVTSLRFQSKLRHGVTWRFGSLPL